MKVRVGEEPDVVSTRFRSDWLRQPVDFLKGVRLRELLCTRT